MDKKRKSKRAGLLGTLVVHAVIVLLLVLVGFDLPRPQEESGMPVMLGDVPQAAGLSDSQTLVPVDVAPLPDAPASDPADDQDLLTQDDEETVAIKPRSKSPDPKQPTQAGQQEESAQTEAQRAEEARLRAEAEAEKARRDAEEAARRKVVGAFGKGAQMDSQGADSGQGTAGSPTGNSPDGAPQGEGGYGTFSLGGRSIGEGGLPRPAYNVQEEGKVVVDITVSPAGDVIATAINRQTNTVNQSLRRAAEEAAKKAKFNAVSGTTNQTGTITYYFKLK